MDLEYKRLQILKILARSIKRGNMIYCYEFDLVSQDLEDKELDTASVLLKLFIREIQEHNSKIETSIKKINNLNSLAKNVFESKLLKDVKVSHAKIDQAIKDNPNAGISDIADKLK